MNIKYYYGLPGQEKLDDDPFDTYTNLLENLKPGEQPTYPIKVLEWEPIKPKVNPMSILDRVLEELDEEYADPDSYDNTEPNQAMKDAAEAFAKVIEREYKSYMCEPNGNKIVYYGNGTSKRIINDTI